jgi:hypothetical protein
VTGAFIFICAGEVRELIAKADVRTVKSFIPKVNEISLLSKTGDG